MLLKSLELQGFKTFPDKTTLNFEKGITAVVGPNGSGKSNISDAIRWVLGEQSTRTLRCSKMEDVIFSGTPNRRAQGYAEVSLTIDNTSRQLHFDEDMVSVTRRYYRSGESEYLINKVSVRLRDVNELFMDTGLGRDGYSVIGQGKIDSIVSSRSEDRREIFEEAAGISRFRYRKEEAKRRLGRAEENLLRLKDIIAELEDRIIPLREQSEKAKEFLELAKEKKNLEIGLWLNTLDQSGKVLREQNEKISLAQAQHNSAEVELINTSAKIEKNYTQMNICSAKIDEVRLAASEDEEKIAYIEGRISVLENDIEHNNQTISRLNEEIEKSANSEKSIDWEIAAKRTEIDIKRKESIKHDEEFRSFTENLTALRHGMDETSAKIEKASVHLAELNSELSQVRIMESSAASSIKEIELRSQSINQLVSERQKRLQELQKEENSCQQKTANTVKMIYQLHNAVKGHELIMKNRQEKTEMLKQQLDKLHLDTQEQQRKAHLLEELEHNMEGFAKSVKIVMRESEHGHISGIHGPLSRLIKVPSEYAVAIETAMGAAMQNIVVSSEQDAKNAIRLLKKRDAGRATFLPLTSIHGRILQEDGLTYCSGFVGIASELCSCSEEYNDILNSVLGRTAVVDTLDNAVEIARKYRYKFRIVTIDGQIVNAGGSLTGGSLARNSGLLSRAAEIESIRIKASEFQQQARLCEIQLKEACQQQAASEADLLQAKSELTSAQEEKIHSEAAEKQIQTEKLTVEHHLRELTDEKETSGKRLSELYQTVNSAKSKIDDISSQIEEQQSAINKVIGNRDEMSRRCEQITVHLQEIRMASLAARKDQESLESAVFDLQKRKSDYEDKGKNLQTEIQKTQSSIVQLREKIKQRQIETQNLRNHAEFSKKQAEELLIQRTNYEKDSAKLRIYEREKAAEKESIGHEIARLEERRDYLQNEYDGIIRRLWEEYELTRREAQELNVTLQNIPEAQKRLHIVKGKIKSLGSVNVAAVEEYKEISERYQFLSEQITDVEQSKEELEQLIDDLTRHMKELFTNRFEKINGYFKDIFKELFGGGSASLSLSDPSQVLSCGIDISVQPPGKIVTHLESLSGGEMSLVAISIYFAIMKVSPPPFCVLDEIEAALDDVNVTRFANYLRRMNNNTQFIAITHRRGTMEEADTLYGVTMQDQGVSKLLELRASEIQKSWNVN